jgi:hypothetical protein
MALNWGVKDVKDYDEKFPAVDNGDGTKNWNNTTFCLAMLSLSHGVPRITEENWEKVWLRIRMIEKIIGGYRYDGKDGGHKPVFFKKQEVKDHVGMWTNASEVSDAKFRGYLHDTLKDVVVREGRAEEKTVEQGGCDGEQVQGR